MKRLRMFMGCLMLMLVGAVLSGKMMTPVYAEQTGFKYKINLVGFEPYDENDEKTSIVICLTYTNSKNGEKNYLVQSTQKYFYKEGDPYFFGTLTEGTWKLSEVEVYRDIEYEVIKDYCICDIPETVEVVPGQLNEFECTITLTDEIQTKEEDKAAEEKEDETTAETPHGEDNSEESVQLDDENKKPADVTITKDNVDDKTSSSVSDSKDSKKADAKESSKTILVSGIILGILLILIGIIVIVLRLKKKN